MSTLHLVQAFCVCLVTNWHLILNAISSLPLMFCFFDSHEHISQYFSLKKGMFSSSGIAVQRDATGSYATRHSVR